MTGSRETICSRCQHLQVCKYKDTLLEAQRAADDLSFHKDEGNKVAIIHIRDIPWIRNVELVCTHYSSQPTIRGNMLSDTVNNPCSYRGNLNDEEV